MLMKQTRTYMTIGIGGVTSAISGLKMVDILEKILQMPNTREHTIDGKYSALMM